MVYLRQMPSCVPILFLKKRKEKKRKEKKRKEKKRKEKKSKPTDANDDVPQ
jgi:hypothetical protein